jgi:formylglycine-generating enzyme required for sulfatase activity
MHIKVDIDLEVPRWARALAVYAGVPAAVILGVSTLVWADVTLPHTFQGGETLTAANLNASFEALRDAINDGNCPKGFTYDSSDPLYIVCTRTFNGVTDEMVKVGDFWVDRYEASWCGSGVLGADTGSDTTVAACSEQGATTDQAHANGRLLRDLTWFQAVATCANAGKHLCTNAEWQTAVSGTPDPGAFPDFTDPGCATEAPSNSACNTCSTGPGTAGQAVACVSRFGVYDMIGNLEEYVADWYTAGRATTFVNLQEAAPWPIGYGDNGDATHNLDGFAITAGAPADSVPGVGVRGGYYLRKQGAGAFAFNIDNAPSAKNTPRGLRCCIGGG